MVLHKTSLPLPSWAPEPSRLEMFYLEDAVPQWGLILTDLQQLLTSSFHVGLPEIFGA